MPATMTEMSKNCLSTFEELEKELQRAIHLDEVHELRNEAKFRAVRQNVESYEEFKEIVNAAHLQPLKKRELQELQKAKPARWNSVVGSQVSTETVKDLTDGQDVKIDLVIPQTYQDFLKKWQKGRCADSQRLQMMKNIKAEWLHRILTLETSSCAIGNVLRALQNFEDTGDDIRFVLRVLVAMAEVPRFTLCMDFLTEEEKDGGQRCFELLRQRILGLPSPELESSRIVVEELEKKFAKLYHS